jgi:hypothetical protein
MALTQTMWMWTRSMWMIWTSECSRGCRIRWAMLRAETCTAMFAGEGCFTSCRVADMIAAQMSVG